jgi:CubicO group peptidase (beta-lactamase class C family)
MIKNYPPAPATVAAGAVDARASDPAALGWMQGSPPSPDRTIRYDDGSFLRFPMWRWSFSHWRELVPTVNVPRSPGAPCPLPRAERGDLDAIRFTPLGGAPEMSWAQSVEANYTDGIVVLHHGRVVYERYFGALTADRPHIAFSVTKSFFGTIAATLVAEGALEPGAPVSRYLPELAGSGFGDATVAQVLDMTTALRHTEVYDDPASDFFDYARATGLVPRGPAYAGAGSTYAYLATVAKAGEHGRAFGYRSINTEVVGWLIARVTRTSAHEVLRQRIWSALGAEDDAHLQVDSVGTPLVAVALNARLRDLARFGEMLRLDGQYNGRQVVPAAVVADLRRGGNRDAFVRAGYLTLPGWSYHNQWWISHNEHGAFMARGIHGQAIYVDPAAAMVIARFASHPLASNVHLDPTSLPAYHALARHLLAHPDPTRRSPA